jgi:uncharacterized protein (DUF169 family)
VGESSGEVVVEVLRVEAAVLREVVVEQEEVAEVVPEVVLTWCSSPIDILVFSSQREKIIYW